MSHLSPSELILHPDGSIYHLKLKPDQLADTIILVGDPARVLLVSAHFDRITHRSVNREIAVHTGILNNRGITVLSTGMGTDNMDIVLNEIDALASIDLQKREYLQTPRKLRLIRIGTSGAIQAGIQPGTPVISEFGLGLDGLIHFYKDSGRVVEEEMTETFIRESGWPGRLPRPYAVKAPGHLYNQLHLDYTSGITATAPGFYAPQGRELRLHTAYPDLNQRISRFEWKGRKVLNFEMETSAFYALASMLDYSAVTVCLIVANRKSGQYVEDYHAGMESLIRGVLERLGY
ncbi:MAG: nucleoside phosphorylase [Bacteroidales bacterium]|nr:nucleoside phosphorylase [Bacteroidales bacterium]